jgi:hypothetical protein
VIVIFNAAAQGRAMSNGVSFDYVLFWFSVKIRKFMSRKPHIHFPEAVYHVICRAEG